MTPERKAEIRNVFGKGEVSYGPYAVSLGGEMARAGAELLAEVERLEALATSLADVASAAVLELPGATAADAEQVWCAVRHACPLDSTPAKR